MPRPAPSPAPEPKPSQPPADTRPSGPGAAPPRPAEEGAIFRALVDAGAEAMVAYSAEQRIRTMVSEAVAPQLQPFLLEMRQLFAAQEKRSDDHERRFDAHDRRFDEIDRRLEALAAAAIERDRRLDTLTEVITKLTHTVAAQGEKLAEHDRKLDVIVARLDGLKVLGHVLLGTLALLITALIAVFGFLFTS